VLPVARPITEQDHHRRPHPSQRRESI